MPHYEINSLDPSTNIVITSVIKTDASPSMLQEEVKRGGLRVLSINILDQRQADIYERMRIMATKRNIARTAISGFNITQTDRRKILWGRVALVIGLPLAIAAALLFLI